MGNPLSLIDPTGKGPEKGDENTTHKGAGGTTLVLPADAKVTGRFEDKDKNGKINNGKTTLEAHAGEVSFS